jgi:quercetin dioxygenase-like cupin family protein
MANGDDVGKAMPPGGQTHLVFAGEAIIMRANIAHSVKAVQKFKMLTIMIRP